MHSIHRLLGKGTNRGTMAIPAIFLCIHHRIVSVIGQLRQRMALMAVMTMSQKSAEFLSICDRSASW